MEDTLRAWENDTNNKLPFVLILVLMEDTLRAVNDYSLQSVCNVLILVLMEDTLREREFDSWAV